MEVSFLNGIFSEQMTSPVFITLIHSLWLGALMALLAGIVILLTKRSGPQLRYGCLTGLLLLFIICTGCIFCYSLASGTAVSPAKDVPAVSGNTGMLTQENPSRQMQAAAILLSFLQTNANIIVLAWFVIVCFKCIKLISGLHTLYILKHKENRETPAYWHNRLNELKARLGISKPVTLLQSYIAKVPMVIGHLKPVILFPVGVLNALPQNEVEAILLHELAHIKRNDFLINLLQQLAEIIFFFNPAVLWVSSLIKNERENCCDDIAIAVTHDKKIFIHALVSFQEYNNSLPCAATFPGSKNHLLNRVKRIITNNNQTLNNMEKLILSSGVIIIGLASFTFSPLQAKEKREMVNTGAETAAQKITAGNATTEEAYYQGTDDETGFTAYVQDTLPEKEASAKAPYSLNFSGEVDGKKIKLKEDNKGIKELYVDGKKIPANEYPKYQPLIDKLYKQMKEAETKLKMDTEMLKQKKEELRRQSEFLQKEAETMKEQSKIMQDDFKEQEELIKQEQIKMQKQNDTSMKIQAKKMQAELIKQQEQFKLKQIEFQKQVEELKLQQQQLKEMIKDSIKVKIATTVKPVIHTNTAIAVKPDVTVTSAASTKAVVSVKTTTAANAVSIVTVQPEATIASTIAVKPVISINPVSEDIIRELEEANIITSRNNLSFRLTNDELIVNGVRQPAAIHQKILDKHVKKTGSISIIYSSHE